MGPLQPRRRRVLVLGRDPDGDVDAEVRRAASEGHELVLIVVGPRVTASQGAIVERAVHLAVEVGARVDALWTMDRDEARRVLAHGDEVEILSSRRERRRLSALLRAEPADHALTVDDERSSGDGSAVAPDHLSDGATAPERIVETGGRRAPTDESPNLDHRGGAHEAAAPSAPPTAPETATESVESLVGREVPQPIVETVWTKELAEAKKRAAFRIYLGMAPGVGKTYAMLSEGHRRGSRGTDVVVGIVQTYGRPKTIEMLQGLEIIPPRKIVYRGVTFEEMDTEAVIARRPEVALVDELAHTNVPGSRRAERWEDVLDLLAEGIIVITTLNVQHLESLNDVIAAVTGIRQQETVPDWVFDLADQVELVDMSPYSLRRRIMHGNVYPDPRKAELALQRFFTEENLTALRELALMRIANQVDEDLLRRWTKEGSPETRERILVCVSRPQVSDALIRRGARMAQRARGDLLVVHAVTEEEQPDPTWIAQVEKLVRDLGGEFHLIEGEDPVEAVLSFAYRHHVTQIVVGESLRPRWRELLSGSFVNRLIRSASNIDVHVIARKER